jgi:molybdopterin-containing oxidoreductase family iron-sulfur binding subunit
MSEQAENTDLGRRGFLRTAAAAAAVSTVAPGLSLVRLADARPPDQRVTDANRWGLLIDASKCADGCSACVDACNDENGLVGAGRPQTDAQWIRTVRLRDRATGRETRVPYMCQHCEHPPCVDVCPTGASFRRADGIVLVDRHICIGCRYCMMACPYKARSFIHEELTGQRSDVPRGKGCVESCTLCVHRVDAGQRSTACADACAKTGHAAIVFGDLRDPKSQIFKLLTEVPSRQIREDLALNTGVRYSGI